MDDEFKPTITDFRNAGVPIIKNSYWSGEKWGFIVSPELYDKIKELTNE